MRAHVGHWNWPKRVAKSIQKANDIRNMAKRGSHMAQLRGEALEVVDLASRVILISMNIIYIYNI